jgi:hypothetical protein
VGRLCWAGLNCILLHAFNELDYGDYQNLASAPHSLSLYTSLSFFSLAFISKPLASSMRLSLYCLSLNEKPGYPVAVLNGVINQRFPYYLSICNLVSERTVRSPQRLQRQYTSLAPCSRRIPFGFLLRNTRHAQKKRIRFSLHTRVKKKDQSHYFFLQQLSCISKYYGVMSETFLGDPAPWSGFSHTRKYIAYRSCLQRHVCQYSRAWFQRQSQNIHASAVVKLLTLVTLPGNVNFSPVCIPVKLHNEELHNLYSSPDIIRIMKLRRMKWAGCVACIGQKRNAYRVLVGMSEWKNPLGRLTP